MYKLPSSIAMASALLAMSMGASASDLPVRAVSPPPVYAPPPFTSTGFYIGGNFGGAWASTTLSDNLTGAGVTGDLGGWLGGGQLGFNYRMGGFVWGIEGTLDWTSLNSTTGGIVTQAGPVLQVGANTQWVSTLAGRFGFAADRALF